MACQPQLQRRLMGVLFDPEALVARLRGGEAEEALPAQPVGEPSPIPAAHGMG